MVVRYGGVRSGMSSEKKRSCDEKSISLKTIQSGVLESNLTRETLILWQIEKLVSSRDNI